MTLPIASALQALLAPGARQQNDRSTFAELNVCNFADALPQGLTLQWLGTAGFCFTYAGYRLLIDPYLTRCGFNETFGARQIRVRDANIAAHVPHADAVLVGHTHFDHALDVPRIAATHGCDVYGSSSLARLMNCPSARWS
jgi:glyoxylase-like metal-dependent hydrolase (beta-lactamase superfamily II)